jgi:tetratricopeptide (TPR) repeat protein
MHFLRPAECLRELTAIVGDAHLTRNTAQVAFIHSGLALASFMLLRLPQAVEHYLTAFELSKKVGDDARMSLLASNLCVVQAVRGFYDDAIEWGELSVNLGVASNSSALQMSYSNLADPYILLGKQDKAMDSMDRARKWMAPRRRWKFHCAFLIGNAAFALLQGNTALALDLIGQLEEYAQGREDAIPIRGAYLKLRIFREAHIGTAERAFRIARAGIDLLRDNCPLEYLDVLSGKAWLEERTKGHYSAETIEDLLFFEDRGTAGRLALLTAQGFLKPSARALRASEPTRIEVRNP